MIKDIKITPEFKAQTSRAVVSIVLFVLVYLIIIALSIALTIGCAYGGLGLIAASPGIVTVFFGVGLASMGFLILVFVIKFIFKSHKIDRSHLSEVTRKDEPALLSL